MYHWFKSISHKLRAGLSAWHTKPFFPWCSVKRGRPRSSILPHFLTAYLPACDPASRLDCVSTRTIPTGLSARSPLDFLGPSVLLCHPGTSPTTIAHTPPHQGPVCIPSATQCTSQNPRTHFLRCKITFTITLKGILHCVCRMPPTYYPIWWKSETHDYKSNPYYSRHENVPLLSICQGLRQGSNKYISIKKRCQKYRRY